jgi:hypothetical protein
VTGFAARTVPLVLSVTTLGRVEPLRRLLSSLASQLGPDDRVAVVAQANENEVQALLDEMRPGTRGRLLFTTSERGASRGRNRGVAIAATDLDDALLMFPNDTTWFPNGSIAAIRAGVGDALGGAVAVMTDSGPRFALPPAGTSLNPLTVWRVIEMGLVIRLPLFRRLEGFDESIGTGATSPWQAGEVTDLLMRARSRHPVIEQGFAWLTDPRAHVGGIEETRGLSRAERRQKIRAYGRGVGHVFRTHDFPAWHRWRFAIGGLAIGILRRDEYTIADGRHAFIGRVEGLRGRTFSGASRAVER